VKLSPHHNFLQRIRFVISMAPHFLYMYCVHMDELTYISERIVGKELVDEINFLRIWERSTRSEKF